jgi:regulator of protease activity HflC (stomatin/prohibitin superfamily)
LFILTSAIKIVKEYERGVIFRLGRVRGRAKGPGGLTPTRRTNSAYATATSSIVACSYSAGLR